MSSKTNIIVICGPTASGKTSLALSIASQLPKANILSTDSRQVYRGLDIVTGKDIPPDLSDSIKFYGLDLVSPGSDFNLWMFTDYAKKVIQSSLKENVPLIIVGGTGMYLKAITSDFLNINIPKNDKLRQKLEAMDKLSLQKLLLKINPEKFQSLNNSDLNNPRRLIRAIEIATTSLRGAKRRGNLTPSITDPTTPNFLWIGIEQDKEILKEKIRQRVIDRIGSGAIEEVRDLLRKFPDQTLPIYTSLGVKNIIEYLDKKITREELIDSWSGSELDYARRQMVWFKKQPGIIWYDKGKINKALASRLATKLKK